MHVIFIYIGVFFGVLFEGEMVMISSVIAAHHGYLDFWLVIVIALAGIFISDCFYFTLGRRKGKQWLNKNQKLKDKASIVYKKLEKYPVLIFVSYRFMYGFRTITPLVIGTSKTKTSTFIFYSSLSVTIWVAIYTTVGYLFGAFIKSQLGHIEHIEKYIIGILILSAIIFVTIFQLRRKVKKPEPI